MKKYLLLLFVTVISSTGNSSFAQTKLIKKLFSNDTDTSRSSSFIPLPVLGYAQEKGLELGVATLYSFYTDHKDTLTRASRLNGIATFTTKSQSNFQLKSDIWAPGNTYHYLSEIRYRNFPFNFYGTGNGTLKANEDRITQKLFRLNVGVEKKLGRITYTGLSAGYDNYRFTDKVAGGIYSTDASITDRDGGQVFFVGVSQILDNRNSNIYTTSGSYLKLNYSYAPDFFGGDNYHGGMFKADLRSFKSLSKKLVIGANGLFHTIGSGSTPFYMLPQLGNDEMMRGYYTGRYRDENLLALQAELRLRLNPRFGFVGFAGTGTVYGNSNFKAADLKPSLGGGFRYFFDIEKGLSIRMDYALGEKKSGEKRQKGFYLSLGESF
ncbi:BamA/TamA family outer membrane protein [Daejeonella sp.]|uniref:BamA/TamA family outer membrane protein n=1 Tax=Daejeonella sp. TaxID=2805397 RepID=UPI0030BB21C5